MPFKGMNFFARPLKKSRVPTGDDPSPIELNDLSESHGLLNNKVAKPEPGILIFDYDDEVTNNKLLNATGPSSERLFRPEKYHWYRMHQARKLEDARSAAGPSLNSDMDIYPLQTILIDGAKIDLRQEAVSSVTSSMIGLPPTPEEQRFRRYGIEVNRTDPDISLLGRHPRKTSLLNLPVSTLVILVLYVALGFFLTFMLYGPAQSL